MSHFFYYFKLNLICYCSHSARLVGNSVQKCPLLLSSCECPPSTCRDGSLVFSPHGWPRMYFICQVLNILGGWWLYLLLAKLCHGCNFSLRPCCLPRGLSGRQKLSAWEHRSPALYHPGGGPRILFSPLLYLLVRITSNLPSESL